MKKKVCAGNRYGGIGGYADLSHNSKQPPMQKTPVYLTLACHIPNALTNAIFLNQRSMSPCIKSSCTFRMNRTLISLFIPSKLQLKPRAHPYPFAIFVKEDWNRAHCQRNKRQKRVPPAQTEASVHRRACKRQDGTNERAQDCIRSQCGCSM